MYDYYVYAYLREKDYTPYYIGKGKGNRAYADNHYINLPSDKSKIVFYQKGLTNKDAISLEIAYIKLFGRKDIGTGILRNLTDGGDGRSNIVVSLETRAKIIASNKRVPKESRLRQAEKMRGRKHSEETKAKMRKPHKGYQQTEEGKINSVAASKLLITGTHWYNNGIKSIRNFTCPDGYKPGRLSWKRINILSDGIIEVSINPLDGI